MSTRHPHTETAVWAARVLEPTKEWAEGEDVELLVVRPTEASVTFYRRHGFAGDGEPLVWMNPTAPG